MAPPLTVTVVSGRNLPVGDTKTRTSDPYAKVSLLSNGKKVKGASVGGKTKVRTKTLNPSWNEVMAIGDAPTARKALLEACMMASQGGGGGGGGGTQEDAIALQVIVLDHGSLYFGKEPSPHPATFQTTPMTTLVSSSSSSSSSSVCLPRR